MPGGAYLSIQHDATCARTAQLIGPAGQVCATLPLDVTASCDPNVWDEFLHPDGTVMIGSGCTYSWWPGLGRPQ